MLEEEAERKDPKRWIAGRIAAAMAKETFFMAKKKEDAEWLERKHNLQ